ncbi:helicase [Opitutaceae bacterium EW11]|nr:helicase [Opitutaceae bacterium EW11]
MEFSLDDRTAQLSVGELSDFEIGPRESGDGPQGIWRAQLGTHWHQEFRDRVGGENTAALFEVPIAGEIAHRGWRIKLTGRIDQLIPPAQAENEQRIRPAAKLRELKTVLRPLPAAEEELRSEYPAYFAQLSTYLALARLHAPIHPALEASTPVHGELVFIEAGSGLSQGIPVTAADEATFHVQLERLTEFLNLRLRARERLRSLSFRPAFATLRPGQESIHADLEKALENRPLVFFEAPTGFGKTGAILQAALSELKRGRFERLLYLTSKSTGQLQVVRQLTAMTAIDPGAESANSTSVAIWHVRNKREHCVNSEFHCVHDACRYLHDLEARWARSDLARFYLFENTNRSLDALREAGQAAGICPYEITRVALAFNDVWIGDYNYVFAPGNRGLFYDQPGFDPKRTLLVVDEAHNLPARVADAYSHLFSAADAAAAAEDLYRARAYAPLLTAWDHWTHFLHHLRPADSLSPDDEDDARHLLETIAKHSAAVPLDHAELGSRISEMLWQIPAFLTELETDLPRLWWVPRAAELSVTCLDAGAVIGPALRSFGAALLTSATFGPTDVFAASCGLEPPERRPAAMERNERLGALTKRDSRKLFRHLSTGADLLQVEEAREIDRPTIIRAETPWRDGAYDVAVDLRVDTTYQQRSRFYGLTASTIETLCAAAPASGTTRAVAVFFPSYSYAEAIQRTLSDSGSVLRVSLQPRLPDLAAQHAWVEESLVLSDALFLVLGSSFAEGIDVLGGRVSSAMIVGPALPEVNAVQRARLAALSDLGREVAFRRVYQVPGIQKVNQALGRLVRAPGQHARVLLHCRRFADPAYAGLLSKEYQLGQHVENETELAAWLASSQ